MGVRDRISAAIKAGATTPEQVASAAGVPNDDQFLMEVSRMVVAGDLKMTKTANGHHLETR